MLKRTDSFREEAIDPLFRNLGILTAALLMTSTFAIAKTSDPAQEQAGKAGGPGWGSAPCAGIALGNFEACPDELVDAPTCCGTGVCASTGQYECNAGQLQDSCVPGDPVSSEDTSCDGVDQDCSGQADEDYQPEVTTCGTGACFATGQTSCSGGEVSDTCTPGSPSPESCNGVDDDCNGHVDDGIDPEPTSCGTGACSASGELVCQGGSFVDTCEPGEPQPETCNGVDDNCNGQIDEGLSEPTSCGVGACSATGQLICTGGSFVDTCEPGDPSPEQCGDGIDNNCNGEIDENC
jgi:hypothetical protein